MRLSVTHGGLDTILPIRGPSLSSMGAAWLRMYHAQTPFPSTVTILRIEAYAARSASLSSPPSRASIPCGIGLWAWAAPTNLSMAAASDRNARGSSRIVPAGEYSTRLPVADPCTDESDLLSSSESPCHILSLVRSTDPSILHMLAIDISTATGCMSMPWIMRHTNSVVCAVLRCSLRSGSDSASRLAAWYRNVPDPHAGSSMPLVSPPSKNLSSCAAMYASSITSAHIFSASQSGV